MQIGLLTLADVRRQAVEKCVLDWVPGLGGCGTSAGVTRLETDRPSLASRTGRRVVLVVSCVSGE
jgi:hypothetical protein